MDFKKLCEHYLSELDKAKDDDARLLVFNEGLYAAFDLGTKEQFKQD